jgi:hypothetical protein
LKQQAEQDGKPFFAISSATNAGVRELVNAMATKLEELNADLRFQVVSTDYTDSTNQSV